jgi:hypothetical protein
MKCTHCKKTIKDKAYYIDKDKNKWHIDCWVCGTVNEAKKLRKNKKKVDF